MADLRSSVLPIDRTWRVNRRDPDQTVAEIYNRAGAGYAAYADGDPVMSDPGPLFAFDGPHAYADRCLWQVLDAKLVALRAAGRGAVRILDAGCGPGTWLRRLVTRSLALGFSRIDARGFDVAEAQIARARSLSRKRESIHPPARE